MTDYGIWNGYRVPEDRSHWHSAVQSVYDYWLAAAPPGVLPGRQHISPLDLVPHLPRLFLVDVHRDPLRFRYRLVGTEVVWSRRRDPTGEWLDEAHAERELKSMLEARYRYMAETGVATWRRGPSIWDREPKHLIVENCFMPLARNGRTVDMFLGVSVIFDSAGRELRS